MYEKQIVIPPANPNSVIVGSPAASVNTMAISIFMGNKIVTPGMISRGELQNAIRVPNPTPAGVIWK